MIIFMVDGERLGASDKALGINAAVAIIANWQTVPADELESRIAAMSDINALRTIAFFSRGAGFPQSAEDVEVDTRLDRMFWASVKALQVQGNKESNDALRIIEHSSFLQNGDLLLFKELGEQARKTREKRKSN
jgi:hypothetical protein